MAKLLFCHSPLIIDAHLLSPVGAALPRRKANARVVSAAPKGALIFCLCLPRVSFRALPSFHPGL